MAAVAPREETQSSTCPQIEGEVDPTLFLRLLLSYVEIERLQRVVEKTQQAKAHDALKMEQLEEECAVLRMSTTEKLSECGSLREQSTVMGAKVRHLQERVVESNHLLSEREIRLQEKDRTVGEKDRHIAQLKQEVQALERKLERA